MIGLRELMLVAVVVLVLYGRSGVLKSRQFQTIWPWLSPQRRTGRPARSMRAASASRAEATAAQRSDLDCEEGRDCFLSSGESAVLVLDDSGRDRRGYGDPRPDDDCKRGRPRAYSLIKSRDADQINSSVSLVWPQRIHFDPRRFSMLPFAFFLPSLGGTELIIVALVCLLIFGNRLPSVMRSLGKSVTEFKKGVSGIEEDIDQAVTADKKTPPGA